MSNFIEDLWYGNIHPHEHFLDKSRDFKSLLSVVCKSRDELNGTLTNEQKELLEEYDRSISEMESTELIEAFGYGFSLGVRLLTEAYHKRVFNE